MFEVVNDRRPKRFLVFVVIAAISLSSAGSALAGSRVTFTARRSPLRVRLVVPARVVSGKPVKIRAFVRNVGAVGMGVGTVKLRVGPRALHSRSTKSFSSLRARARRVFTWRAVFKKSGVYTVTVSARVPASSKMIHINGAAKKIRAATANRLFGHILSTLFPIP